jgi:hypothetical protein
MSAVTNAVGDGDGGVLREQKNGGGLADDVAAAEYDGVGSGDGDLRAAEDFDDSGRSAGSESGLTLLEAAGVHGMESVNIFVGEDGVEHAAGVDVGGEGELDEDSVNVVAGVEAVDEREHFVGSGGVGRSEEIAEDAELFAGANFGADVNFRSWIVAGENGGEAGADSDGGESGDLVGNFGLDLGGDGGSIEGAGRGHAEGHRTLWMIWKKCRRAWSGWCVRHAKGGWSGARHWLSARRAGGSIR